MAQKLVVLLLLPLLWGCSTSKNPHNYSLSLDSANEAMAVYKSGNYEEAVRQYEFLTAEVPKDTNFWFYLGNSYLKNKQPQQAEMAYENALFRDPKLGKAWYNLGILHMREALRVFVEMRNYLSKNDPAIKASEEKMKVLLESLK